MLRRPAFPPTTPVIHSARIWRGGGAITLTAAPETAVDILLPDVDYKVGTYVSTATANALVPTVGGWYLAECSGWFTGASSEKNLMLMVNGTNVRKWSAVSAAAYRAGGSAPLLLATNAVVTIRAFAAGTTQAITGFAKPDTALSLTYMGPSA